MPRSRYLGLLKIAKEQVKFGIYAIEKNGYAELFTDSDKSVTELKSLRQTFRKGGFKVHANGI